MTLTAAQMRSMVKVATGAPSSHNTQPWRFTVDDGRVELRADRTRALPVNDPLDRELTISCGAALFNLEVAAATHGFRALLSVLPDSTDADLLAVVTFAMLPEGRPLSTGLADALEKRHTTREPFGASDDLPDIRSSIVRAAKEHAVHLVVDVDREALSAFVAEGDRAQFSDPAWRRELANWMRPRRKRDGLVVPEILGLATRTVVSLVDLGSSTADKDSRLTLDSPIIAVLATDTDGPPSWVETGRALQHVLLVAAASSVNAGFLNQPCQVAEIRERLQEHLVPHGIPQVIVRLGRVDPPKRRAPRRPVEDVVTMIHR